MDDPVDPCPPASRSRRSKGRIGTCPARSTAMCDASEVMPSSDGLAIIVLNLEPARGDTPLRRILPSDREDIRPRQWLFRVTDTCAQRPKSRDGDHLGHQSRLCCRREPCGVARDRRRGRVAPLLNNDATLCPGASDALVARATPGVAAVCPMVIDQASVAPGDFCRAFFVLDTNATRRSTLDK